MGDVQVPAALAAEQAAPAAIADAGAVTAVTAADSVSATDSTSAEVAEMVNTPQDAAPAAIGAAPEEPRMGQVVEYCLNAGIYPGAWRPALVIRSVGAGCAQLAVLTDFANDGLPCPLWAPGATRGDGPGQWREQTEP